MVYTVNCMLYTISTYHDISQCMVYHSCPYHRYVISHSIYHTYLWYHSCISHVWYHICDMKHFICDIQCDITWMVYTNSVYHSCVWYITYFCGISHIRTFQMPAAWKYRRRASTAAVQPWTPGSESRARPASYLKKFMITPIRITHTTWRTKIRTWNSKRRSRKHFRYIDP